VEEHGPMVAGQLRELIGHDQVVLKPVIDLNDHISVDAYEIPDVRREAFVDRVEVRDLDRGSCRSRTAKLRAA
jgi:hypothetical protein